MAPPNTRPPSRPPLTSRIRASFETKRRKSNSSEGYSPMTNGNGPNGFFTQDPESLRRAVDEAINSEAFQNAIAANLAKLIKPSIKSALDTIQPVVEAVYNHEVLLRKTNRSVENILERLESNIEAQGRRESVVEPLGKEIGDAPAEETKDTEEKHEAPPEEAITPPVRERVVGDSASPPNLEHFKQLLGEHNGQTATKLSELSSSVEASNAKIAEVVQGISDIQASLGPTKKGVDALNVVAEQSTTTASVMQAQLDQLSLDIGSIIDAIGADLGKNVHAMQEKLGSPDTSLLSSHTTKLDAIATDLGALKGHSDTMEKIEAISAELTGLKASIEAGNTLNTEGFHNLGSQITTVLTTIEGHTGTLGEIKDKGPHPEILAALQQSNDLHAAHAATLGEIKEKSFGGAAPAPAASLEVGGVVTAALQDLKAELASLKENITAGLTSNNENVTGVATKIDTILSTVEAHKAADASPEILAAVQQSNESHASHAAALEEIKSLGGRDSPATESGNVAALEAQLGSLHTVLEAHTATLDEIKTASGSHATALEGVKSLGSAPASADNSALESQIGALAATLETHTSTLDDIKSTGGLHSSALDDIKAAHSSHAEALEGIKSIGSSSAPAETDLSGLESQIAALTATLDSHSAALDEIKSTGGVHSAALDEIKTTSASHATTLESVRSVGGDPAPATEGSSIAALEAQVSAIVATLASHTSTLDDIKTTGDSHKEAVINALGTHTSTLDEIKGTTASHATALEQSRSVSEAAPATDTSILAALETQIAPVVATLSAHTAILDDIKSNASPGSTAVVPASNPEDVEGHFSHIIETLDAHSIILNELKDDVSAEILTNLQAIGQSQAQHIDLLTEIREADVSDEILTLLHASGESHANTSSALSQIHESVRSLNDSQAAHTTALDEIKSRSIGSAPVTEGSSEDGALHAKIDGIASTLESHNTALSSIQASHASHTEVLTEIRDATAICNESHADHALALSEIKEISSASNEAHSSHIATLADIKDATTVSNESHASHAAALASLKELQPTTSPITSITTPETPDVANLETSLNTIIATLSHQTATLSTISDSLSDNSVREAVLESRDLLSSHTSLLETIKTNSSHEDILSNISTLKSIIEESKSGIDEHSSLVRDLHTDTKETHSNLTSAIAGLAVGGAAGAAVSHESDNKSDEILTEVKSVREKVDFVVSQLEINHTTITTSITTLSDELKAEIDASGTQVNESLTILDSDIKTLDLGPVSAAIRDLEGKIDGLGERVQDNHAKVGERMEEGVHLNDTGLSQLHEHAATREVVRKEVPEGMWFGSGSPSVRRHSNPFEQSNELDEEAVEAEDEGEVLEAIPEVDTPMDESPVKDAFEPKSTIEEEEEGEETGPIDEVPHEEEVVEPEPETVVHEVVDEPAHEEETGELGQEPELESAEEAREHEPEISHATEHEHEEEVSAHTETEVAEESKEILPEPEQEPEHVEENGEAVPESHVPEEVEQDASAQEIPFSHEAEEGIIPPSHEDETEEVAHSGHHQEAAEEATPVINPDSHEQHSEHDVDESGFHHEPSSSPFREIPSPSLSPATQPTHHLSTPPEEHATPPPSHPEHEDLDPSPPTSPSYATKSYPLSPPLNKEHNPFEDDEEEIESASTSAIASPLSPVFSENGEGGSRDGKKKKGKGKKEKGEKKKKEKVPFVMEGEDADE